VPFGLVLTLALNTNSTTVTFFKQQLLISDWQTILDLLYIERETQAIETYSFREQGFLVDFVCCFSGLYCQINKMICAHEVFLSFGHEGPLLMWRYKLEVVSTSCFLSAVGM